MASSDFLGTSPRLFCPETLIYVLPVIDLNQMLNFTVAIKCEQELLLFAGMNDHLHSMRLLEVLRGKKPISEKVW